MSGKTKFNFWEVFRLLTPITVTIALFMINNLNSKLDCLDGKIFTHMTNGEIHIPRSTVVSKAEFDILQNIRDSQFAKVENSLSEMRAMLIKLMDKNG